jgi:hypothetical protein
MSANNKISFTVRRPTPVSRASSTGNDSDFKIPALPVHMTDSANSSAPGSPLRRESPKPRSRTYEERDSSDEDGEGETEDELVTGFDKFGVQRCVSFATRPGLGPQLTAAGLFGSLREKKKPQGPLVIPALKNKDWRELARKRKNLYVPPSAAAQTGADGSVGGLGTKDSINSGPQLSGLQVSKRIKLESETMQVEEESTTVVMQEVSGEEETEDQKAIRALIASAENGDTDFDGPRVDIIPAPSEDDAYRQDVAELPDSATMDDYERVPVSQFGAALLRGMGWKEGTAASRKNKGPIEPWLPTARPALLGIGAKEKEVLDDGSKKKKTFVDKRYIPVIKQERRDGKGVDGQRDSRSGSSSRRTPSPRRSRRSPSAEHRRDSEQYSTAERDRHRDRERDRRRDKDRDGTGDRDRTKEKYRSDDRHNDRERKRDGGSRDADYDSRKNRYSDSDRHRDRSNDRDSGKYRRDKDRR